MRYSVFRAAYVAFRTLGREAAAGHAAVAIAASLFCAIVILWLDPDFRIPYVLYFSPVLVAVIYGAVFTVTRDRRVWSQFPTLRREMRERRMDELRNGGYGASRIPLHHPPARHTARRGGVDRRDGVHCPALPARTKLRAKSS